MSAIGFKHGGSSAELKKVNFIPRRIISIFSALLYGTVGLFMGIANKAILIKWPYSNTLLMLQMLTSIIILYGMHYMHFIVVRPLEFAAAKNLAWVVFFYNANVAFALAAVQALTIPVYHVMKRLTPVVVLLIKLLLGDASPPTQVVLSVLTVVAGCIISGLGDLSFDASGYSMAIISCILQAVYLVLVEKSGSEKGYTSNELLLYNAILSLPVLIAIIFLTGEARVSLPLLWDSSTISSPSFISLLLVSLVMGSLLNYALFLCTLNNSALTTTIVGTMRSVIGTVVGFFILGGVKANLLILLGVSTNTMGGIWYTVLKYQKYAESFKT